MELTSFKWEPLPQRVVSRNRIRTNRYNIGTDVDQILICNIVGNSGEYNFKGCKIPVSSGLKIENWRSKLANYHDKEVVDFLE